MSEYSICTAQPWVCTSLPRILIEEYLGLGLLFVVLCLLIALLLVVTIPFIKRKKRTGHPVTMFAVITLFLLTMPIFVLQLGLAAQNISMTSNLLKCMALKAPDSCYVFAAVTASTITATDASFTNSFAICDSTQFPEKCKVAVCDYIHLDDVATKTPSEYLKTIKKSCWEAVAPTCPNGNILENIPCGCYSPELSRYAVHTEYWLEDFWEKYRKMDPKPYCCDGQKSAVACR